LQTLGEILRAAREKQGISVKDVEKATSIRALYIQAIEDGNYGILPGEVYLKGFIRNYANFLHLNGQEMVDMYRKGKNPSPPPETAPQAAPASPAAPTEPARRERREADGKSGSGGKWFAAVVVVLLLAGAAWLALSYWNGAAPSVPPTPAPQAQNQPTPAQPAAPQKTPAPVAPTAPAAKPVVIIAKFTDRCWILVTADSKIVYEGTPRVGETLTWNADRNITLRVGNAFGVDITVNGQPQGKLGGDGEVLEKTYTTGPAPTNIQKP
jgi:cytoskeletal protein RodZ